MALLLAAAALRRHRRGRGRGGALDPVAAHVQHHLRDNAERDAELVAGLCRRLDVPYHRRDVHPGASPGNLAANARRLRYEALCEVARDTGAPFVATAHHAADQLETMLAALGRGAGIEGLAGMRWARPLGEGVTLVRPLLEVRPATLRDLCRRAGAPFHDDPTNADPSTLRGRLRRDVLPVLEELWPGAAARASGTAGMIDAARALVNEKLRAVFGPPGRRHWPRAALRDLPAALVAAGLRRAVLAARGAPAPGSADSPGRVQLQRAAAAILDDVRRPRRFQWPGGLALVVRARMVELRPGDPSPRASE